MIFRFPVPTLRYDLDHELASALAQQTARAADRQRRKEVLARERVLRLGNTPEE